MAWRVGGMGGQCPGAPELKRPGNTERKRRKGRKRKENGGTGAPESPLFTAQMFSLRHWLCRKKDDGPFHFQSGLVRVFCVDCLVETQ